MDCGRQAIDDPEARRNRSAAVVHAGVIAMSVELV
jgi:hypothetical protein